MGNGKLSTIQKREKLNEVIRLGEPGPGGAYHDYEIWDGDFVTTINPSFVCEIKFQKGPRKDYNARHGVLDQDLLEIVRDRLNTEPSGFARLKVSSTSLFVTELPAGRM